MFGRRQPAATVVDVDRAFDQNEAAVRSLLAQSTSLAPDLAEQALQAAAADFVTAKQATDVKTTWKQATDNANASLGAA